MTALLENIDLLFVLTAVGSNCSIHYIIQINNCESENHSGTDISWVMYMRKSL